VLFCLVLGGCATQKATLTDPERDPWEGYNRKIHAFNEGFDKAIFRPVAKGYDFVMPDAPQRGVRNFFRNLNYPVTLFNSLLQGKMERAFTSTGRFLMNSSIGLFGFFDVATKVGIPYYDEDFGQTLAVWGWQDSRYLVMPFLGPFTMRDLLGRSFYGYFHPISYAAREHENYWPLVADLISLRAELLPCRDVNTSFTTAIHRRRTTTSCSKNTDRRSAPHFPAPGASAKLVACETTAEKTFLTPTVSGLPGIDPGGRRLRPRCRTPEP
jgi:phospholipid-binding lipoprotein MlaA